MNNLEEIIAEARRNLTCPVCGRSYAANEIRLRGFLDNAYIIQTVCSNGHMPIVTVFVAVSQQGQAPTFTIQTQSLAQKPLDTNDVIEGHKLLKKFQGNIGDLWQKK